MKLSIRDGSAWEFNRMPHTLTEDQIAAIANDARTRPLAEIGRHVMPLVGHITALEDRCCQRCRHWVPWNQAEANQGECLYHAADGASIRVKAVGEDVECVAVVTPFDWQCKGWEERLPDTCEAQKAL